VPFGSIGTAAAAAATAAAAAAAIMLLGSEQLNNSVMLYSRSFDGCEESLSF
jgi:hypothetical protein